MRPRADLAIECADGEFIILDKRSGKVHQLNPTASVVWRGVSGSKSNDEIAVNLVESFDVNLERAAADVKVIIAQFRKLDLLGD